MQNIKNVKDRALAMEFPVIGGILLVYTATVFFQSAQNWNIKSIVSFSLLITLHAVMYLYREQLFKRKDRFLSFPARSHNIFAFHCHKGKLSSGLFGADPHDYRSKYPTMQKCPKNTLFGVVFLSYLLHTHHFH